MLNATISTRLFTNAQFDPNDVFDMSLVDGATLDFETELQSLVDGTAAINLIDFPDNLPANPTISSTEVIFGDVAGDALTLTGLNLTGITDVDALFQAAMAGNADLEVGVLSIYLGGVQVLQFSASDTQMVLTSGTQVVTLTGAIPDTLQEQFNLISAVIALDDISLLTDPEIDAAIATLSATGVTGLMIEDGSEFVLYMFVL